jgi:hypothetical protein
VNLFAFHRKDKSLPFYALHDRAHVDEDKLSLVEKGRLLLTPAEAARVGRVLGIPNATPEMLLEEVVAVPARELAKVSA